MNLDYIIFNFHELNLCASKFNPKLVVEHLVLNHLNKNAPSNSEFSLNIIGISYLNGIILLCCWLSFDFPAIHRVYTGLDVNPVD